MLDPLKLVIDNYPEDLEEACTAPVHPHHPDRGVRIVPDLARVVDRARGFVENPPKGYFRLFPGNKVRLRYGYVIECTGFDKDADGNVTAVHCNYFPDSKSGTEGANTYKVKGNIHWVSAKHAQPAEVRIYDRLFSGAASGRGRRELLER